MAIHFFAEGIDFKLPHPRKTSQWIKEVIRREGASPGDINYIFCSDAYLLAINKAYLKHSTFTDIITFDLGDEASAAVISGEIYISVERVRENAIKFARPWYEELHRVIIHGVLHLLKYSDKGRASKALMRKKEEACLSLLP